MNTQTKKIFYLMAGAIVLVVLSALSTIGLLSLREERQPNVSPLATQETQPVSPNPVPATPVVQTPPQQPVVPMAQIMSVNPHYVTVSKPQKYCYEKPETIYPQQSNSPPLAGALVGGVAGGLAGSAIKGKSHNTAIAAGAVLGALTGGAVQANMNTPPAPQTVYKTHCGTKTVTSKVQKGYEVTYTYNGQQSMIVMPVAPATNLMPLPQQSSFQP